MKKLIPSFLKPQLVALYVLWRLLIKGSRGEGVRLNLAGVLPPLGSQKIIHGGKVKLIHLRERFGNTWRLFNLAYFVSSGLPPAPAIWIKFYKTFGIKVVWNQNGFAYPALYTPEVIARIHGLFQPIKLCDYVIYQTEFTKRCAEKFLGEIRVPSSILINPVDTEVFKPRATPLPLKPLTIMMLGNHFESEERMTVSLEALRKLREQGVNLKLIVIGHLDRNFTEDWIDQRGAYLQSDAPALFQSAHLFLHLKYLDPCPTAVLEALASGVPVIGSGSGGMPELVNDASGVLVLVPEDFNKLHYPPPQEVAEAIKRVIQNLVQYSREARQHVMKFDKTAWLNKHEALFNQLLK